MAEQSTPNSKGPAPFQSAPSPATAANPEGTPTLKPTYADGVPVLSVSEGHSVPKSIDVVDAENRVVARYTMAELYDGRPITLTAAVIPWQWPAGTR
ncbi:hypothetical protein ACFWSJ_14690 [Streptomyces niveus]|uniref:hypothetical protein n=1 Tax=Streptomyces niveus TaxID=193462 RepID=UPI003649C7DB